jgi:cysteine desulfurase
MHTLAKTRCRHMARSAGIRLTDTHMAVLEYAWDYYRERRVGPLYTNITRNTGVDRKALESIFPNGGVSIFTWAGLPVLTTSSGCKPMALIEVENPREVYLDYNATTPIRTEVADALSDFFQDPRSFGNPSSSYGLASVAYDVIHRARKRVASCLSVSPAEIYFVGSGSEANNLAIKGIAAKHDSGHIISTNVEHASVLGALEYLGSKGFDITYLPVAADGTIAAADIDAALRNDTILVTIMAANNEVGTIYPFSEIGAVCRARGVPFHVDGIQAFGKIPIDPKKLGITMLTMSGHKIGAPKGIGAIYVDSEVTLEPLIHGGGQEHGIRAGTENVAGIMAMGLAARLARKGMAAATAHYDGLRAYFLENLAKTVPEAIVHGTLDQRLPNNLNIGFPGIDSGSMLLSFDQIGVYVSAGSACSASDDRLSHVLEAIGADSGYGAIRFSFGLETTTADLDYLFRFLRQILDQLVEIETGERAIA